MQGGLAAKDQIGGIFRLPDAPMVAQVEGLSQRAVLQGQFFEPDMQLLWVQLLRQLIGDRVVGKMRKSIIEQVKGDAFLLQLVGQPGMSVEIKLQAKWIPGRHTEIAQTVTGKSAAIISRSATIPLDRDETVFFPFTVEYT